MGEWYLAFGWLTVFLGGWLYGRLAGLCTALVNSGPGLSGVLLYAISTMATFRRPAVHARLGVDELHAAGLARVLLPVQVGIRQVATSRWIALMDARPSIVVLTPIPSPYQVELFDAVAGRVQSGRG